MAKARGRPYVLSRWRGSCSRFRSAERRCLWLDSGMQRTARCMTVQASMDHGRGLEVTRCPTSCQCSFLTEALVRWQNTERYHSRQCRVAGMSSNLGLGTSDIPLLFSFRWAKSTARIPRQRATTQHVRPPGFCHSWYTSVWNSLPDPVRNPNSTEAAFWRLLKTFLFTWY